MQQVIAAERDAHVDHQRAECGRNVARALGDLVFDRAESIIRDLADAVTARRPGESLIGAIRRDYAEKLARQDPTLGLSSPAFAGMVRRSPVLTGRGLEMLYLRERALGDAIAAEAGRDGPECRTVAAVLASVHRVLYAEAEERSLAGQPRDEICAALEAAAARSFDVLEPSLGGYGVRRQPDHR